ncbi:putative thiazole-containing bacteriocin maturation protein [Alkalihalobacillus sp. BA299]|uniref:putative thiazole-containing bacteriocin maturation protein n=1 Tax=Alkalihalobacillus sp. BA299 TaxID=2815938 RepID=UPI001ADB0A1B|nr:putative thiazole-containing bacteriocin maturation protein [Alkalihalobacillus sp. BA299]
MTNLTPSMRLKVKRDTFFLPDQNSSVYFRNNVNSFRMEGSAIDQWVEKLMPMFNGEYTLGELTKGLPGAYRDRVYEIAEVLYQNGYVKDVSQDRPHQLEEKVFKKFASQIEFLNSFGNSGAYRFQTFRQAKVLAIGSGAIFVSLVSALIESGLSKVHVLVTDSVPTNWLRLKELVAYAHKTDPEVAIEEVPLKNKKESFWREVVQPFDSILYVSQGGEVEELRVLHQVCKDEKKVLLPAICLQQVGLAGPLVDPDSDGCWESMWRRIHHTVFGKEQPLNSFSPIVGAMLANVIVFELFKKVTGVSEMEQKNQFFLLRVDTLEGNWHSFLPHPLLTGGVAAEWVRDADLRLKQRSNRGELSELFLFFSQLTSAESGIFHIWEEGDLKQLPLAQCRVQVVDPLSIGPAKLLPSIVCTELTHQGARREAGLSGVETYVSRMIDLFTATLPVHQEIESTMQNPDQFIGVGAGETFTEAVCRGLQRCLTEELKKCQTDQKYSVSAVQLTAIEDERCRFYLQALTTIHGAPKIGLGEEVSGFPVVWVGTNGCWYSSVGLNITLAFQKALQQAIKAEQNEEGGITTQGTEFSSVLLDENVQRNLVIDPCEETSHFEVLQTAIQVLKRHGNRLLVFELGIEPFFKEKLAGVYGVLFREEES